MRITRIDFEGRHEIKGQAGHWYATAQRRDGMHSGPDIVLVTILAPDTPDGREHHVDADCEEDLWSMAECLQHQLDGYTGSNSEINDYYLELLKLSNC
jgi:hypothetical protein